jgi:hypothetical protein
MLRIMARKVFTSILLAYFALFIVPPVSSFAHGFPGLNQEAYSQVSKKDSRHATLFLFDIILWQQLKQTRQSDSVAPDGNDLSGVKHLRVLLEHFLTIPFDTESGYLRLMDMRLRSPLSDRRRSSAIFFSRSGNSPPFFS